MKSLFEKVILSKGSRTGCRIFSRVAWDGPYVGRSHNSAASGDDDLE